MRTAALGLLVVGAALVVAAVPRGLAAWEARGAGPVVHALGRGQSPDDASLAAGIEALQRAADFPGSPASIHGDLALLLLESARRGASDPERALAEVGAAVEAQRRGLALSPADGSGWARLVYAHDLGESLAQARAIWALDPDDPGPAPPMTQAEALEALEMAFLTRDLSFSLVRFRLQAAGERWASLPPWLRTAARKEVLELTRYGVRGADALVDLYLARPDGPLAPIIEEELQSDPKQQTLFERRLARRPGRG